MESILTKLSQQKSAAEIQSRTRESYKWLLKKISEIKNPSRISAGIKRESDRKTTRFLMGGLYCFFYDPKGKADLPYYDTFPLVLVLEKYSDGFLGLNLHYLPIKYRLAFLDKLMQFAVLDENEDPKRIRVTYDILSASRRFREFQPCIKRYLYGHLKSKILTIHPDEWETAVFLPMQQFKGAKPAQVWKESVEEFKRN